MPQSWLHVLHSTGGLLVALGSCLQEARTVPCLGCVSRALTVFNALCAAEAEASFQLSSEGIIDYKD